MIEWDNIQHFAESEFADSYHIGSGSNIDMSLVLNLDHVWTRVFSLTGKKPVIIITQAVDMFGEHGHAVSSYHLNENGCKAADLFMITTLSPREQYYAMERQGFGGIGVYYDWKYRNKRLPIGFHVDLRPVGITQRWSRHNKHYNYLLGRDV